MNVTEYTKNNVTMFERPNNWTEVKAPELFSFEKIGDSLTGRLLDLRFEKIDGRDVLHARMELDNGDIAKFRPSFDVRQKLGKRHLGKRMLIVFDSEESTGKENALKLFRVFVEPDQGADSEAPFVATDADVPDFDQQMPAAG
jgi:hypothetical protein